MSKEIISMFKFHGNDVRVVDKDGNPWFIAKDVCDVLGLVNPTEATRSLDDDEKATLSTNESGKRPMKLLIISESGLYELVLGSRKPKAKEFKQWIRKEVIPSIRKEGYYAKDSLSEIEMLHAMTGKMLEQEREAKRQKLLLKEVETRVDHIEEQQKLALEGIEEVEYSEDAPKEKTLRAKLNQLVRSYAVANNLSFQEVWNRIYTDHKYRYNMDIKRRAHNKGMRPLDIAEKLGKLGELFSVASNLLKGDWLSKESAAEERQEEGWN